MRNAGTAVTLNLASSGTSSVSTQTYQNPGPGFHLRDIIGYSIQFVWAGTGLTGTAVLQWSNDNVNFTDISGSISVSGTSGSDGWIVSNPWYKYVRVSYTAAGGTGTANLRFEARGN